MRNEFIYDIMRSEEIREYYRKNVEFDTEEQLCVIMSCYKSLEDQLKLIKNLEFNQDDKLLVDEMIKLYELIDIIYKNPHKFFGDDCNIIYAVHYQEYKYNIRYPNFDLVNFFDRFTIGTEYFNSLEKTIEHIKQDEIISFEIEMIIIKENEIIYPINFYCNNINEKYVPIRVSFDDDLFKEYQLENALELKNHVYYFGKKLPFENGCKVKFQIPIMQEPFYGFLYNDSNEWDEGYYFMHEDNNNDCDFLNMSYVNLDKTSDYAIFDWLESVKEE